MARAPLNRQREVETPRKQLSVDELERGLLIDEHQLEHEWREQPERYFKVGRELAYAISERDQAAQYVKEIEAEVDTLIRKDAEVADERLTEKAIESQRRLDRRVIAAHKEVADLSLRVGLLQALVGSYSHRRDALESLVKLFLSNYYGTQDIGRVQSGDGRNIRDATADRARQAQRNARR